MRASNMKTLPSPLAMPLTHDGMPPVPCTANCRQWRIFGKHAVGNIIARRGVCVGASVTSFTGKCPVTSSKEISTLALRSGGNYVVVMSAALKGVQARNLSGSDSKHLLSGWAPLLDVPEHLVQAREFLSCWPLSVEISKYVRWVVEIISWMWNISFRSGNIQRRGRNTTEKKRSYRIQRGDAYHEILYSITCIISRGQKLFRAVALFPVEVNTFIRITKFKTLFLVQLIWKDIVSHSG